MKIFLLLFITTFVLFGASIDRFAKKMGFERDYTQALEKAKQTHKPLMMVLSADYCPWCRKFERKTLSSSIVKSKIDKDFVVLVVDKKFDKTTFPNSFQAQFTPRVFFINPLDASVLLDTVGYIKKATFLQNIDEVEKLYKGES